MGKVTPTFSPGKAEARRDREFKRERELGEGGRERRRKRERTEAVVLDFLFQLVELGLTGIITVF